MAKKNNKTKTNTAPVTNFDWAAHFKKAQTRKTIANLVQSCIEDVTIDPKVGDEVFVTQILSSCPDAYKFLPEGLVPDAERRKVISTLNKLAKPETEGSWYRRDNRTVPVAVLALMSIGVESIDFQYSGGWDETSYDERAPRIEFHDGALSKSDQKRLDNKKWTESEAFCVEIFDWVKEETGVEPQDILYAFLDDSGAGDGNTYSQNMKLDLAKWSINLHDYEEDENDYDDEDENEA